jgi:hypothetical protein
MVIIIIKCNDFQQTQTTDPYVEVCPISTNGTTNTPNGTTTAAPTTTTQPPVTTQPPGTSLPPTPLKATIVPDVVAPTPLPSLEPVEVVPRPVYITQAPGSFRSSKPPSPSHSSTKSPDGSIKSPSGSKKEPTPTVAPIHATTKLPTLDDILCPPSAGKGKSKKGKGGKGKGKGGEKGLSGPWSESLFEKYEECPSAKKKKSDKKSSKHGKGKGEHSKKKGKGKGHYYYDDEYYYDDDENYHATESIPPYTAVTSPSPSYVPTPSGGSSLKGHVTSSPSAGQSDSADSSYATIIPYDNDSLSNSTFDSLNGDTNSIQNVDTGTRSFESNNDVYNDKSLSQTTRALMLTGTILGACLFTFGIAVFGRQQYVYQRKIRAEKALNIMKGLISK